MKRFLKWFRGYIKATDKLLFLLCVIASLYGIVLIASSTGGFSSSQTIIQIVATVLGIGIFILVSSIDTDTFTDNSRIIYILSVALILTLIKWGVQDDTGNRAWLRFGSVGIQPAEIVKVTYAIVLVKVFISAKERHGLNSPLTILKTAAVFGVLFVLIVAISSDLGSALIYLFMFIVMLFAAGISLWWFAAGFGVIVALAPLLWKFVLRQDQKDRILAPYDPSIDPTGLNILWQSNQSKAAIANGGFTGQGLFHGTMTQSGSVPQQSTDFIFTVAAEELGFIGCIAIAVILLIIIARCVYVGVKSNYTLGYLLSFTIAAMLLSQMLINIGMCLGLTPVVGLTLPFFSYGGSSVITSWTAMGLIAGIKMRPKPESFRNYY
ncbi:MAG: rod shape-determining protein RodA [Oscillospiraceae bacterium]|nr:rod shape-determining protein RodA [Oscillospiraceae bacterium]